MSSLLGLEGVLGFTKISVYSSIVEYRMRRLRHTEYAFYCLLLLTPCDWRIRGRPTGFRLLSDSPIPRCNSRT